MRFGWGSAILFFLSCVLFAVGFVVGFGAMQGCGPRDQVREIFPKDIPIGYGPRANECAELDANKDKLDGIGAIIQGDVCIVKWSHPATNPAKLPATVTVSVKFHCAYPKAGRQNQFEDGPKSLLVYPGEHRLVAGEIRIPLELVETKYAHKDPERWFDRFETKTEWSNLILNSGPLTFEWLKIDKDGQAIVRWIGKGESVTHKITPSAKNCPPVTLDTAKYPFLVTCFLIDKDGNEVAKDQARVDGAAGQVEAIGFFRKPAEALQNIDWGKCRAEWVRQLPPEEKPQSSIRVLRMRVTAYCPCSRCCGRHAHGWTASETNAHSRGVAADWRILPPGTQVVVPGYGPAAVVDDRGGRIFGNRLDVRFCGPGAHAWARAWGVQWLDVIVEG